MMIAVFLASFVECVEAFTIVLAMGLTRSWKAAIAGTITALVALALVVVLVGNTIGTYINESVLQLLIGTLLLIFGLQWLRKAVLRSSGLKALHDEEAIFKEEQEAARRAGRETKAGLDWFAFVVSFKGMFLEGIEVAFITVTIGLSARDDNPDALFHASMAALAAAPVVLVMGLIARKPLSKVPENALKFSVALLLVTCGVYWAAEGIGYFSPSKESYDWPTGKWALVWLLGGWSLISYIAVRALKRYHTARGLSIHSTAASKTSV